VAQVELESLVKVAAGATVAGVGVTLAFALALRGFIAAVELHRHGDRSSRRSPAHWPRLA
jgi:hypothetical protein